MKTSASLACLAPLLFIFGCAAPAHRTAYSHPAGYVENRHGIFGRGTSRAAVVEMLGQPHRQLNENNWIYRHFGGKDGQSPADDCHTLLINFSANHVEDLQLINAAAERVFAARIQARAGRDAFATHEPRDPADPAGPPPELRYR